jgi:serine/threonine-protein kinase RsbW
MWRRWTLLGGLGALRPPFPALELEAEFASEPAISAMFRRHPRLSAHGKTMFRYTVPSDPQFIPGIVHVVAMLAMEFGFEVADYVTNIPLALDEAISNAIKHGNKSDAKKRVEIEGQVDGESLRVKVRDEGAGFERDLNHDPLDPVNLLAPNGRGLFLIESLMDDVKFTQDGRCIEMIKRARPEPAAAKAARGSR